MKYKNEYIGRQFKKIYDDGIYTLKPLGLQREGKKYVTYNLADSIKRIENGEYILMLQKNSEGTREKEKNKNTNGKEYRKSLEIESQNIVSPNSKKLISDIAFFIDLENDFDHDSYRKDLHKLLHDAYDLLVQDIEIHKGSMGVNLAVIGNFSSGKSSFINSLIGRELCPVKVNPTTSSITRFIYSDKPKIMLVDEGKEISSEEYMDLVQHSNIDKMDETRSYQIDYHYPFEEMRDITIYDTPGFNNPKNTQDEKVTMEHASEADVIFLVMDINNGDLDNSLLNKIKMIQKNNSSTKWHLIVNKSDLKPPTNREKILLDLQNKYADKFETIIAYSSKNSDSKVSFDQQLENIYKKIKEQIEETMAKRVSYVDLHLNMKKNGNSKIYDCYVDNSCIGELQAEKDVDKLKKKQKEEVLSILKDIGSNKYNFLFNKFDSEFSLYESSIKKLILEIQDSLISCESHSSIDLIEKELESLETTINNSLGNRVFLKTMLVMSLQEANIIKLTDYGVIWDSDYFTFSYSDSVLHKYKKNNSIKSVNDFIKNLFHKFEIETSENYINFDFFIKYYLFDGFLRDIEDEIKFENHGDANKFKQKLITHINKNNLLNQKMNFDNYDNYTKKEENELDKNLGIYYFLEFAEESFLELIDSMVNSIKDDFNRKIIIKNKLDDNKLDEIRKKINTYLGEENVR